MRYLVAVVLLAVGCQAEEPGYVDPVPAKAHAIEGSAEDAFDHALAGDWATLAEDASRLDADWKAYRAEAVKAGLDASSASALDDSIAQLGAVAAAPTTKESAARAANAVSASMDEVFGLYDPHTPVAVLQLDYLGRELWLDGLDADFPRATTDLVSAKEIWATLATTVISNGGKGEAAAFDQKLSALSDAVASADGAAIAAAAQAELDQVDVIETVFAKTADPPD